MGVCAWLRGPTLLPETAQNKKTAVYCEDELAALVCLSRW